MFYSFTVSVSLWAHLISFRVFCKNYDMFVNVKRSGFTSLSRWFISNIFENTSGLCSWTEEFSSCCRLVKKVQINSRLFNETPCKYTNTHSHLLSCEVWIGLWCQSWLKVTYSCSKGSWLHNTTYTRLKPSALHWSNLLTWEFKRVRRSLCLNMRDKAIIWLFVYKQARLESCPHSILSFKVPLLCFFFRILPYI